MYCMCVYLIVFNGLGEWLHVDCLVQLVFVQQVDKEVQRSLVDAHLRIQRADLLIDVHTALSQSSDTQDNTKKTSDGTNTSYE